MVPRFQGCEVPCFQRYKQGSCVPCCRVQRSKIAWFQCCKSRFEVPEFSRLAPRIPKVSGSQVAVPVLAETIHAPLPGNPTAWLLGIEVCVFKLTKMSKVVMIKVGYRSLLGSSTILPDRLVRLCHSPLWHWPRSGR